MTSAGTKNAIPGVLVLEDGTEFEGFLFGAAPTLESLKRDRGYGEVVFNTSMTGYQEILTDPSYYGQIVCMTTPHIGNTGINPEDPESAKAWCGGFIVHEFCSNSSNWRARGELNDYLIEQGVPGLFGVDTRALTLHLRSLGVARGVIISSEQKAQALQLLDSLPRFEGRDLIGEVTARSAYSYSSSGTGKQSSKNLRVVAMDFGVKWNLLKSLEARGCEVEVVPASTPAQEILKRKPDGIFLSNGPGDPSAAPYAAETVRQLIGHVPLFGVCMGHQILALALGAKTYKLKFGHRGGNQPVLDQTTGRVEISSHNHGYAVAADSLPTAAQVTHINLNDRTVEGMSIPSKRAFSVQYHPEACPGPHDSELLFDRFIELMKNSH